MKWWAPPAWPAPAKLNLMLRVVGRRADGYHLLQTVFQFLDYGDSIEYRVRDGGRIVLAHCLEGVPEEQDLVFRAARLLQQATGCNRGADIHVHKLLPVGGGLGGGSSDAATTLVALNQLWKTGLSTDDLAVLALGLGADVPVFVRGHAAWGEGVGDILTPVDLSQPWFLVVRPAVAVSTGDLFKDPELTRNSSPITIADFVAGEAGNDCLPVVVKRYPAVAESLAMLAGYGRARLTGTGACVFVDFANERMARNAISALPSGVNAFVARGINRSPLLDALGDQGMLQAGRDIHV